MLQKEKLTCASVKRTHDMSDNMIAFAVHAVDIAALRLDVFQRLRSTVSPDRYLRMRDEM